MKIYETEDDGVIGEFLYQTVEFDQNELVANGGVISQGAAQRYLAKERPDLKIKKCGSFKLDSQANTITMRFAVVNQSITLAGVDGSKIEGEKSKGGVSGDRKNHTVTAVKLLNPGYDELKTKCDELQHEKDIIGRLYDALVIAVGKDAQKFSDLLVENEELKAKLKTADETYEGLRAAHAKLLRELEVAMNVVEQFDPGLAKELNEPEGDEFCPDEVDGPHSESIPTLKQPFPPLNEIDKEALKIGEDVLQIRPGDEEVIEAAHEVLADPENHIKINGQDIEFKDRLDE